MAIAKVLHAPAPISPASIKTLVDMKTVDRQPLPIDPDFKPLTPRERMLHDLDYVLYGEGDIDDEIARLKKMHKERTSKRRARKSRYPVKEDEVVVR